MNTRKNMIRRTNLVMNHPMIMPMKTMPEFSGFNVPGATKAIKTESAAHTQNIADFFPCVQPDFHHFPIQFLADPDYLERAKIIYREGCLRAAQMVGSRAIIRPYVQAFLLTPQELAMERPEYGSLLLKQLDGVLASPASGFTLWNPSNRYYMVTGSLAAYAGGARNPAGSPGAGSSRPTP